MSARLTKKYAEDVEKEPCGPVKIIDEVR